MRTTTPGTGVLRRRLVAALGATALLASAGCGNDYVTRTPASASWEPREKDIALVRTILDSVEG